MLVGARAAGAPPPRTAAALVIGNELLSGKVQDENVVALAQTLRPLGILLRRVVMILDDVETIAAEVRALASAHDVLVTSGGVGPTHDDVTIEAVARAFDRPVVADPATEALIRAHYKRRCTPGHLRMALMPEGAALETTDAVRWPTVRYGNTWVLPGIPEIFRMKLGVLAEKVGAGRAFVSRSVYTQMDEGVLKPLLDRVVEAYPDVEVGSYPKWMDARYKTKVTFDGRDDARIEGARAAFVAELPAGEPQDIE